MADQKAAIMVSVNALLIGALITFVSYRNWIQTKPEILLPLVVFIACALVSLVYAVVASRPYHREGEAGNLAFYGTQSKMNREDFIKQMERSLLDPDTLYGTLLADLHGLGKSIDRKYHLLKTAYNIFLIGLGISIALIVAIIFI